ncbi:MAG: hypothetical protein JWP92_3126 [Caulobacter sp.]|nr:hypothetical protein [Caulobacter sp.]
MTGPWMRQAMAKAGARWVGAGLLALAGGRAWGQEAPHTAAAMLHLVPADQRLALGGVILHARLEFQFAFVGLLAATVAALAVWAVQRVRLGRGQPPEGGLAFLSALVAAAPLLGLTIAAYNLLKVCMGLVNFRPTPDLVMLAPAFAEATLAVFLGLLTAAVAAVARGHLLMVQARGR